MARKNKRNFRNSKDASDSGDRRRTNSKSSDKYETNDAKWYTLNAQRALDAGRLSFNIPSGSPVFWDFDSNVANFNGAAPSTYSLPGVCGLDFVPTYGILKDYSDPLNVAARNLYSNIRYKNSGAKNYDPNDLMLYLLAMDNCYMWYQHLVRIYGIAMLYSQLNRHYPTTIFKAMNIDADDIIDNLSDYRTKINVVAAKLGSLCVPANFPIFLRHMWMTSGIYADAPTPKAQMYVFVPREVGYYDETTSPNGGALIPYGINYSTPYTRADLFNVMDTLINGVMSSEDCGIISGDIRKAYENSLFQIAQITDDYKVVPVYSEEVLRQIQNATVVDGFTGSFGYTSGFMIEQDANASYLTSSAYFGIDSDAYSGNRIMTGSDAQPTPEEVLVNSRLMVCGEIEHKLNGTSSQQEQMYLNPTSMGTEVIVSCWIYGGQDITGGAGSYGRDRVAYCMKYHSVPVGTSNVTTSFTRFLNVYSKLDNFNYHPRVGTHSAASIGTDGYLSNTSVLSFQDIDNYCVVGDNVLFNLHNTALLSLFNIPE